ncbi:TetR/AcrR family transcriptional regulator [Bacillus sp. CLL-7-23]|uniref:TetR/AcrR family transcriptional regulator n=1 Tax=Bacillus changyiensis TaxID=3004103 RepID=A0ABT4X7T7_9BACI|nr:TetR/AcrR family transcriptional regulator [Bacillus changyiensis]MDA7028152.1 TetR/AcrR family transcriptional regulator [Bacillus changyiensis]
MTKQLTRERIIQAALILFKDKGYAATSTRKIAEKAGVNHLTLFRHFENKSNLFRESVVHHVTSSHFFDGIKEKLTENLREDLTLIAKVYLEENIDKNSVFWVYLTEAAQDPEVSELIMEIPKHLNDFLSAYLSKLHDHKKISNGNFQMISNMFFSLLNQYIMFHRFPAFHHTFPDSIEEFVVECVDLFQTKLEKDVPF